MVGKERDEDGEALHKEPLELGDPDTPTNGIKCLTEIDGLRVINPQGIFFIERVQ